MRAIGVSSHDLHVEIIIMSLVWNWGQASNMSLVAPIQDHAYLTKQVEQVLFDLRVTKNPVLLHFPNCYYLSSLWEINCSCSRLKLEIANLISIIMVKGSKVELRLEISDKEKKKKNNCGDGFRQGVNKSSRVLKFQAYSFSFVSNVSWDRTHYQTILHVQLWFIFL